MITEKYDISDNFNKINSIFIQSFFREILNNRLQHFLDNLSKKKIDNLPIILFLDLVSKKHINKLDLKNFKNIEIIYVNDKKYKNATSTIFHYLINYKTFEYPNILLLESDCKLRDNFINIINEDIKNKDYWIYGSCYYGIFKKRISFHINGVAIYNRTKILLEKINNILIKQNKINDNINYDFIITRNLNRKKLIDSNYILNISRKEDKNINFINIKKNAVIIHQKI